MADAPADPGPARPARRFAGLGLRAASAALLAPVALASVLAGSPLFDLLLAVAAVQMAREWGRMADAGRIGGSSVVLAAVLAAVALALLAGIDAGYVLIALAAATVGLRYYAGWRRVAAPGWLAAGVLALGVPVLAFDWLQARPGIGQMLLLWLFATIWATDVGAYVSGRLIGGPRLAPRVSPNKTWAGLVGGMLAAGLAAAGVGVWGGLGPAWGLLPLGAGAAVVAQMGDLAESAMKRHFGVKDSGGLIPGHGGLLDRIDGFLTLAPLTALLVWAQQQGWIGWPSWGAVAG